MDRASIIRAAELIASHPDLGDDEMAALLVDRGFARDAAYRLVGFLPLAFARPVLEALGVADFVDRISLATDDGGDLSVRLSDQPEFREALDLARERRRSAVLPQDVFRAIVEGTAEIDAASHALNAGEDISGATIACALICPRHADHAIPPSLASRLRWWIEDKGWRRAARR